MGYLKITMEENFLKPLQKKLVDAGPRAAHMVASQIAKDTEPFVPALTKSLVKRSQAVENKVIWPGPYARYLYYGKVMVYPQPPYKVVRADGKTILTHYGQQKAKIEKPLDIKKKVHAQATSHWFEKSAAQNMDKWVRAAGRAIIRDIKK